MNSTDVAKNVIVKMAGKFSNGLPKMMAKSYIQAPEVPLAKWSWNNRMIAYIEGTMDARGYNQWGAVGRYVKKGAKAIYILAPRMAPIEESPEAKQKREADGGKKPMKVIGFKGVPVFRKEDTDGKELEDYKPASIPPLYGLAEKNGIEVEWANSNHGEYGSMSTSFKKMTLSCEDADVFFHELVHYYDLRDREDAKGGQDETQELVAQLGSAVLCEMHDIDAEAWSWAYIQHYVQSKDPEVVGAKCMKLVNRVGEAIDKIMADAHALAKLQNTS